MPKVLENIQLGFSACRIGFRKCWQWMLCHKPQIVIRDQYCILCLGLSRSGKSTVLAHLVGESADDIEPTTGFNIKTLPVKQTVLNIKELGGNDNVRPFWNKYFAGQHGIIFVVDISDNAERLELAKEMMRTVLSDSALKGVPCILLGTYAEDQISKTNEQLHEYFESVMDGRRWKIFKVGLHNVNEIRTGVEILVDMITPGA